jgi:sarcosine oxidase subunit gamma
VIRDVTGLLLASVIACRGKAELASEAAERAFGTPLPMRPRIATGRGIAFAWSGPGQWLAIVDSAAAAGVGIEALLEPHFVGLAAVCEQSDGRLVVEISGAHARDVLAKGIPVDLHPRVFAPGDVALSTASLIAVQLWQLDDAPTYRLAVARSTARSFRHWLGESAAEYGCVVG